MVRFNAARVSAMSSSISSGAPTETATCWTRAARQYSGQRSASEICNRTSDPVRAASRHAPSNALY